MKHKKSQSPGKTLLRIKLRSKLFNKLAYKLTSLKQLIAKINKRNQIKTYATQKQMLKPKLQIKGKRAFEKYLLHKTKKVLAVANNQSPIRQPRDIVRNLLQNSNAKNTKKSTNLLPKESSKSNNFLKKLSQPKHLK